MRRLLLLVALSAMALMVFAPAAMAQSFHDPNPKVGATCPEGYATFGDPSTGLTCYTQEDYDAIFNQGICADTASPEEAIACLKGQGAAPVTPDDSNPATLEGTCEGIVSQEDFEACDAARNQYVPETPTATETYSELPDTGGTPLLALGAGALLVAGGIVGHTVIRRH